MEVCRAQPDATSVGHNPTNEKRPREPHMFGIRKKKAMEQVDPDLPITPMLDMSFQLMAFFIFTFRPAPTEGQIVMALPKKEGVAQAIPSPTDDKPVNLIVRVEASKTGTIASMHLIEGGGADVKTTDLGASDEKYQAELKAKFVEQKGGKAPKLTLEVGDGLLWEYVVHLIDLGIRVGFTDVAHVPIDPKKR